MNWRFNSAGDGSNSKLPDRVNIFIGTSARALVATLLQPLDSIKIRIQLCLYSGDKRYPTTLRGVIARQGFSVFYHGLSATVLRQIVFVTTRLTTYSQLFNRLSTDSATAKYATQLALDIPTSACAAYLATPAEMALIRMTSDSCIPMNKRQNYKHVFDALYRIYKEEGLSSLWKGAGPMTSYTIVSRTTSIICYPPIQRYLMDETDLSIGFPLHIMVTMITELLCTVIALPMDTIKTKVQSGLTENGTPKYKGPFDTLLRAKNKRQILRLWRGFLPYYIRRVPYAVLSTILIEYMTELYTKYKYVPSDTDIDDHVTDNSD